MNHISSHALNEIISNALARGNHQFVTLWSGLTLDEQAILIALSYALKDADCTTLEETRDVLTTLKLRVSDWYIALDRLTHRGLVNVDGGHLDLQLGLLKHWVYRSSIYRPPVNDLFPQRRVDDIKIGAS